MVSGAVVIKKRYKKKRYKKKAPLKGGFFPQNQSVALSFKKNDNANDPYTI